MFLLYFSMGLKPLHTDTRHGRTHMHTQEQENGILNKEVKTTSVTPSRLNHCYLNLEGGLNDSSKVGKAQTITFVSFSFFKGTIIFVWLTPMKNLNFWDKRWFWLKPSHHNIGRIWRSPTIFCTQALYCGNKKKRRKKNKTVYSWHFLQHSYDLSGGLYCNFQNCSKTYIINNDCLIHVHFLIFISNWYHSHLNQVKICC